MNLPISFKKTYLNSNSKCKIIEVLVKIDPSKDFFVKDLANKVKIELNVTEKNQINSHGDGKGAGSKKVHYAISSSIGVGDSPVDTRDDEGIVDDDQAYANYQA